MYLTCHMPRKSLFFSFSFSFFYFFYHVWCCRLPENVKIMLGLISVQRHSGCCSVFLVRTEKSSRCHQRWNVPSHLFCALWLRLRGCSVFCSVVPLPPAAIVRQWHIIGASSALLSNFGLFLRTLWFILSQKNNLLKPTTLGCFFIVIIIPNYCFSFLFCLSLCRYCFIVTMGYLIICQITRVYVFDYGMYSADFTGWAAQTAQEPFWRLVGF